MQSLRRTWNGVLTLLIPLVFVSSPTWTANGDPISVFGSDSQSWSSVLDDPGMRSPPRTQWCGWSFCNGAKAPVNFPAVPSPRMADCAIPDGKGGYINAVSDSDNALGVGQPIPGPGGFNGTDVDLYARRKELYFRRLCSVNSSLSHSGETSAGWSVMFKSGVMDTDQHICPCVVEGGRLCGPKHDGGKGSAMNQPLMVHHTFGTGPWDGRSSKTGVNTLAGYYAGTYDVDVNWTDADRAAVEQALRSYTDAWITQRLSPASTAADAHPDPPALLRNASYLFTAWYQQDGATVYYSGLRTSTKYPWLMNYLRSNDVVGGYGGYPWDGAGVMRGPVPSSSRMLVKLTVLGTDSAAAGGQFYLPEISGCWKLDGQPCDGDLSTDVTRYLCFVLNPSVRPHCSAQSQSHCPPWHMLAATGEIVYRNDTERFPYSCYLLHCYAPNDPNAPPGETCDPYSNPNPQELVQVLPCAEWGGHGFPTVPGQGWVGDARNWTLNVGGIGSQVFFSGQDPPAEGGLVVSSAPSFDAPAPGTTRQWISFEVGPEQNDPGGSMIRWEVQGWDVQVPTADV